MLYKVICHLNFLVFVLSISIESIQLLHNYKNGVVSKLQRNKIQCHLEMYLTHPFE